MNEAARRWDGMGWARLDITLGMISVWIGWCPILLIVWYPILALVGNFSYM